MVGLKEKLAFNYFPLALVRLVGKESSPLDSLG